MDYHWLYDDNIIVLRLHLVHVRQLSLDEQTFFSVEEGFPFYWKNENGLFVVEVVVGWIPLCTYYFSITEAIYTMTIPFRCTLCMHITRGEMNYIYI